MRVLRKTLPTLNDTLRDRHPGAAADAGPINVELQGAFGELQDPGREPLNDYKTSLVRLGDTFNLDQRRRRRRSFRFETVCNYWEYWFTFLTEHITQADNTSFSRVSTWSASREPPRRTSCR